MKLWMADLPYLSLIRKASKLAHHFEPFPISADQLRPDRKAHYPAITDELWQGIASRYLLRLASESELVAYARLLPLLHEVGDGDDDPDCPPEIHLEALFYTLVVEKLRQRADIELFFVGSEPPCVGCFLYLCALKYGECGPDIIIGQSAGEDTDVNPPRGYFTRALTEVLRSSLISELTYKSVIRQVADKMKAKLVHHRG